MKYNGKTYKILINAANLHVGGGVQVASSFISEIQEIIGKFPELEIHLIVSNAVFKNIKPEALKNKSIKSYEIIDIFGLTAFSKKILSKFKGFDAVFSIFGPIYLRKKIPNHIIGFAQSWILYPKNDASMLLPPKQRILLFFKFRIQWIFFRWSASHLVVELQHVKDRLVKLKKYPENQISITNNCVSSLYFKPEKWEPISKKFSNDVEKIKIGYIARAYPHKNIKFLLDVAQELKKISNLRFDFFVTLTEKEWNSFSTDFRSAINNIGPLTVTQCPSFYEHMDAIIFPSLLESFSATPLEAMAMRRPLFASDRGFVHDCCKQHAFYIDPLDSIDASKKIHHWFSNMNRIDREKHIENAYQHVLRLPNSQNRAFNYLKIIKNQLQIENT